MIARKIVLKMISIGVSLLILLLLAIGFYQGGKAAYDFGYRVFTEPAVDLPEEGEDKVVSVTKDMGAKKLGDTLARKGLIRDANLFVLQLGLSSYSKRIKEGTYTLSTSMTAQEMMQVMSASEAETETETEEPASEPASETEAEAETEDGPEEQAEEK